MTDNGIYRRFQSRFERISICPSSSREATGSGGPAQPKILKNNAFVVLCRMNLPTFITQNVWHYCCRYIARVWHSILLEFGTLARINLCSEDIRMTFNFPVSSLRSRSMLFHSDIFHCPQKARRRLPQGSGNELSKFIKIFYVLG